MKLDKNGISAKLYRWFYGVEKMPSNLCPYFWKLSFMYLFIIPYSIINIPSMIAKDWGDGSSARTISSLVIWGFLFLIFVALYLPISYFIWGWGPKNSLMLGLQSAGFVFWVAGLAVLITMWILNAKDKKRNRKTIWSEDEYQYIENPDYRPTFIAIVKEFIKAKYHRYCPKIDWK
jgi:hypothetical protein